MSYLTYRAHVVALLVEGSQEVSKNINGIC